MILWTFYIPLYVIWSNSQPAWLWRYHPSEHEGPRFPPPWTCELWLQQHMWIQTPPAGTHINDTESFLGLTAKSAAYYLELINGERSHLVFQLGNLPLARCIVLKMVQHDLGISQKGFGALQVFPEALFSFYISVANLGWRTQQTPTTGSLLLCPKQQTTKTDICKI